MPLSAGLYYFHHEGGSAGKPPMVLLHGAGGDYLVWPPEIRRLPGIRVYALDLPGHGKSGGPGCQSVEDYARAVVGLMDAVGLWRAAFVGHSMGGAIALTLALDFPERTAGLGLVSCLFLHPSWKMLPAHLLFHLPPKPFMP
jgi:pimeloyl-ACP methyl ester carboxylesterase